MDITALLLGLLAGVVVGLVGTWLVLRSRQNSALADVRKEADATVAQARQRADEATSRAQHQADEAAADARRRAEERAAAEVERARGEAERAAADTERARAETERMKTALEARRGDQAEALQEAALAREEAADARAALAAEQAKVIAAQAAAAAAQEQAKQLGEDRTSLVEQFKLLSQETIDRQQQQNDLTAKERLEATARLMAPMNEALKTFQDKLSSVEKERVAMQEQLKGEVSAVRHAGNELRRETAALANALRKPHVRGAWGETHLRRVAEIAGMVDRCDFTTQESMQTEDGLLRPDMTVNLADGRQLFVDSKVPLSAWLDAGDVEDEDARAQLVATFGRTVRTHVDQLGGKNYWRHSETEGPDFVVLFLPGEAFLQAALEGQADLYEYAMRRNIVLASPSTLIALLRTVALGWRQAALAANARQVLALGKELHDRLATMGGNLAKLGSQLEKTVRAYNATVGNVESRVLVSARRFNELQVADADLVELEPVEVPVRALKSAMLPLEAPEELDGAAIDDEGDERALLRRGEPTTEDLAIEGRLLPLERPDRRERGASAG